MTVHEKALFLKQMIRIRRFEEKSAELYSLGKIRGFLHLSVGQEAIAVGTLSELHEGDPIVATYREHGHALCRGISVKSIFAEMYGKQEGCSRGRGGSMHLFDVSKNFFGGQAIVAGGLPLAVGLGLALQMQKKHDLVACFFGDGAVAEGAFHESLNLAALWRLPVLFVCENNFYAMGTPLRQHQSQQDLALKARSYNLPAVTVNGMDLSEIQEATRSAALKIRQGEGPYFIEFQTYRYRAHSMYDPDLYRSRTEIEEWKKKDPILAYSEKLKKNHELTDEDLNGFETEIAKEIEEAIQFAENGSLEPIENLTLDVTASGGSP
jgi:pyruvate dehydrogenase E1 component alpha subunit